MGTVGVAYKVALNNGKGQGQPKGQASCRREEPVLVLGWWSEWKCHTMAGDGGRCIAADVFMFPVQSSSS